MIDADDVKLLEALAVDPSAVERDDPRLLLLATRPGILEHLRELREGNQRAAARADAAMPPARTVVAHLLAAHHFRREDGEHYGPALDRAWRAFRAMQPGTAEAYQAFALLKLATALLRENPDLR
ncbi:MAG TPA: hypothetical protein VHE83_08960 [Mycobacteriales bacterium]|nr:hypothetical protein [Mycobacteriales bacterium]